VQTRQRGSRDHPARGDPAGQPNRVGRLNDQPGGDIDRAPQLHRDVGDLTVPIAGSFRLEQIREAVTLQAGRHAHGKVVVTL